MLEAACLQFRCVLGRTRRLQRRQKRRPTCHALRGAGRKCSFPYESGGAEGPDALAYEDVRDGGLRLRGYMLEGAREEPGL